MDIKKLIKDYWVSFLLILFGGILEYLTFSNSGVPLWIIGILVIIIGILQMLDKMSTNKDFTEHTSKLTKSMTALEQSSEEQKKTSEQQRKISEEQLTHIKDLEKRIDEKQKLRMNLVTRLMDRGLISEADVIKHLSGRDAYILYCYSNRAPVADKIREKRLYPSFLKDIGFVRMGSVSSLFITTSNRLTKRLQDPNTLKQWLLKELRTILEKEWKAQLGKLSDSQRTLLYKRYGEGDYTKFMNMDILIFKTRMSGGNIGIINKNILPSEFTKMLGKDINFEKIELEEEKKIEIKKFIFESSFQLFFSEIPQDDLEKLSDLESKLKQQLNINNFIDYTEKSTDDIKLVFKSSFEEPKALEYANLLKQKAKEYEEALKELGINTA